MFDLSKQEIDIPCPKCGTKNKIIFEQGAKQETITCSGCKKNIELVDKDGFIKKSINDVNGALDRLNDTIKKFGK